MLAYILSKTFPPRADKLGKIHDVDAVLRLYAIRAGTLKVEEPEPADTGVGRLFEWPDGRHRKGRRVWRKGERGESPNPNLVSKPDLQKFRVSNPKSGILELGVLSMCQRNAS